MQRVISATDAEIVGTAQVWQGGNVLVVVEDPVGVKAVNMRNHERPPILSSMAGGPPTFCCIGQISTPANLQFAAAFGSLELHPSSYLNFCICMCPQAKRRSLTMPACSSLGESLLLHVDAGVKASALLVQVVLSYHHAAAGASCGSRCGRHGRRCSTQTSTCVSLVLTKATLCLPEVSQLATALPPSLLSVSVCPCAACARTQP